MATRGGNEMLARVRQRKRKHSARFLNSQALRPGLNCFAPTALGGEEFQIGDLKI
jgi:hypothetical protein